MFILKKNAKKYVYTNLKTIASVEEQRIDLRIKIPRETIKVCVIDDEGFDINMLYDLGYKNIRKKIQFESMDEYEDYDIILCDIEGIGINVDVDKQGLAVAEQIKDVYPEKVVLLYSGKNVETFGEMPKNLDGYLRKQSSMSELAKSLDAYYKQSIDPINVWKKTRDEMLNNKVSTKTVAFLEDRYCRSLLEGKGYLYNNANLNETEIFSAENISKYIEILAKVVEVVRRLSTDV
ncbi:hypothetical protein B5E77_02000 [Lachnoclostridium sp. An131]|uniref:response regulator transcription factor n=1 Tax=unclassified Lachnoclostridium TaxID=2608895 RepID=UPI000B3AC57A|nr:MULTISPECIES: response regulator transcription factor [unclassified Lachnoclostridium]OUQ20047.1 hypothetical protein B5E82_04290 [Lachnoclostridium sp. An138]OUQ28550.1 hypothetical protein B5E77_02000 [Lachnoclostridium sp. An131]